MPHVPNRVAASCRLERDVRFLLNRQQNDLETRRFTEDSEVVAALQRVVNDPAYRRPMLTVTRTAWGRPAATEKGERRESWERAIRIGAPKPTHVAATQTNSRALREEPGATAGAAMHRWMSGGSGAIVTPMAAHVSAALDEHAKIVALLVALRVCASDADLPWAVLQGRLRTALRTSFEQEVVPNLNERRREREAIHDKKWTPPLALTPELSEVAPDRTGSMEEDVITRIDAEREWNEIVHRAQLSPLERKLLFLESRVGLTATAAAEHLGLSPSYARVAKNRIRERLGENFLVTLAA